MMRDRPFAVVTGASTGIGYELARRLALHEHELLVTADDAELTAAAERLRKLTTAVVAVRADLTRADEVRTLLERIADQDRPVDVLVINAGTAVGGEIAEADLAAQLAVVDLNVRAAVHLSRVLVPGMVRRARGRILFTSSIAALAPGPYQATYNASKAFLLSFSQALRAELARTGVTVTTLLPGPTDTPFFRRTGMTRTRLAQAPKDDPATVARQACQALAAGRPQVVTGSRLNRLAAAVAKVVPEPVKAALHRPLTVPRPRS
ncbi:MAG TPA: SDR family NAD(P)-dependent oxidoreductase [Pseudonocardiaceae bacterium]